MTLLVSLLTLNWFASSFVYYGISLNAGALSGDIFVNNTLNGVMEIASYAFLLLTLDRFGRRRILAYTHLLAGAGLLASMSISIIGDPNIQGLQTFGTVLAFVAKFAITASFGNVFQYTSELFPTSLRSNGMGICSTLGRLGSIAAPFLIDVQLTYKWLPNTIFGTIAIIAGLSTFLLPDTLGAKLPDTDEEAVRFYDHWRNSSKMILFSKKTTYSNEAFNAAEVQLSKL